MKKKFSEFYEEAKIYPSYGHWAADADHEALAKNLHANGKTAKHHINAGMRKGAQERINAIHKELMNRRMKMYKESLDVTDIDSLISEAEELLELRTSTLQSYLEKANPKSKRDGKNSVALSKEKSEKRVQGINRAYDKVLDRDDVQEGNSEPEEYTKPITHLSQFNQDLVNHARSTQNYKLTRNLKVGKNVITGKVTNGSGRMKNGVMTMYYINGKKASYDAAHKLHHDHINSVHKESLDESKEYAPEEGHKVKIIGKGMEHTGKTGYVHQVSPRGTHAGVQDKKGKHIGYYHSSDLKQLDEETNDGGTPQHIIDAHKKEAEKRGLKLTHVGHYKDEQGLSSKTSRGSVFSTDYQNGKYSHEEGH
jgi:hypothetical protein